jgi:hypothetical protein
MTSPRDLVEVFVNETARSGETHRPQPNVKLYARTPGVNRNRSTPSRVVGDVSTV